MDRRAILTRDIKKDMLGIEVGPWFSPLVPKAEGYKSLVLDVFDRAQLLERARADGAIAQETYERIEEVDFVGGATDLPGLVEAQGLAGRIDYIASSHNLEHLPNPVLFLQGCAKALKPGGFITMAIPDRRGCFDFFRPFSTTADFLEAFHAKRSRPTAVSIFEKTSLTAKNTVDGQTTFAWYHDRDGGTVHPDVDLREQYQSFVKLTTEDDGEYRDSHCSVFTRSSFELIVRDLQFLGLIDLGVAEMGGPAGCEFFAKLVKGMPVPDEAAFKARRTELLHEIVNESGSSSRLVEDLTRKIGEQEAETVSLQSKIASSEAHGASLEARLKGIHAAQTWRLTSPLRRVYSYLTRQPSIG